ncbi:MAG TPA: acyltransferase family protein [Bacillota bacterium]|nr:acyltransferase family protein [Bacillota bacterium]
MQTAVRTHLTPTATQPTHRMYFLDNLRVFLAILVIAHHAAITYGASGSWYYYERSESMVLNLLLSFFVAVNQFYFMGLFFFIAGFFTPGAYDRKAGVRFWRDKLLHLGVPLAVFVFTLNPVMRYLAMRSVSPAGGTFGGFYRSRILNCSDLAPGPLWFVWTLLIFTLGYTLVRWLRENGNRRKTLEPQEHSVFTGAQSVGFATILGIALLVTRQWFPIQKEVWHLQLAYFPQYFALFCLGVLAYRRNWLSQLSPQLAQTWLGALIPTLVGMPLVMFLGAGSKGDMAPFFWGFSWQCAVSAFVEAFCCTGICINLLVLFRNRFNTGGQFARFLARNTYPVYITHGLILILLSLGLRDLTWPPLVKFLVVTCLGVAISFLVSHFVIRRLPGVKQVL